MHVLNSPQPRGIPTKRRSEPLESVRISSSSGVDLTDRKSVLGFYSLFSVTEEPFVISGGIVPVFSSKH